MQLRDFAYCDFTRILAQLAGMCPEKWTFGAEKPLAVLHSYIRYTFEKLFAESGIQQNSEFSLMNTGLYTPQYEAIYGYFTKNRNTGYQEWYLSGFMTSYQLGIIGVSEFPKRANYFQDPSELIFDTKRTILLQYDHVFGDAENLSRIPAGIRESPVRNQLFDGAIERARKMIDANYKTAVPQYHRGKIQLLIPLFLESASNPSLALVVSKGAQGDHYLGHTCLTLEMAYNNARLIARPDSMWLCP